MPPNEKSYIITATSRGLGMSRVPVMATARSQTRTSSSGKPPPSAMPRSRSARCRRRRAAAGASVDWSAVSGSAVTCSLNSGIPSHELLGDDLVEVGHLADLLVLEHQLGVSACALHEHVVDLPGELHVRHRELDRLLLLAELLRRHFDDLRRIGHGVVDRLAVHID